MVRAELANSHLKKAPDMVYLETGLTHILPLDDENLSLFDKEFAERQRQEKFIKMHQQYFLVWNQYLIVTAKSMKEKKFMNATYFRFEVLRSDDEVYTLY
ncbi:hypothetical protein L2E82_38354 [Cichorium intybus]|uniref:Uncharacterized protein n=1 Tax=Cichorium intybus TaxID=13427 RepID=A0ACB9AGL6_CICIN|nr:hypothetical protein L2E82_38354 [Cichorium intybus]